MHFSASHCRSFLNIPVRHTQPFSGLLSGITRVGRYQKKHSPTHTNPDHQTRHILDFMMQEKTVEAEAPTIRLDATPSGLSVPPPPSSPPFSRQMPFLPQLSQFILAWDRHRIMLACIPGRLGYTPIPSQSVSLDHCDYIIHTFLCVN